MRIRDIAGLIDDWAPVSTAWEKDNVGLQVGSPEAKVGKILVALDATPGVVDEAAAIGADLVVCHHPLLFHPLRRIDPATRTGSLVESLVRKRIGLYAAHTNLDVAPGGVSHALALRLGLTGLRPLSPLRGFRRKIAVFVPPSHAGGVMQAMAGAGAGTIGGYESCSFVAPGTGSFVPGPGTAPYQGRPGRLERADEVRLEMECPSWLVPAALRAMRTVHPYDEVAVDVIPLEGEDRERGLGAVGTLRSPLATAGFLRRVRTRLGAARLRFSGRAPGRIRTVAVCGGSGSDLLPEAVAAGADAYVTGDVRYHTFQEHESRIVLVDAGHYETERPGVAALAQFLRTRPMLREAGVSVAVSRRGVNPVRYY